MNPVPSQIVYPKKSAGILTGKPQQDMQVFLSLMDHEVGFCERALVDGRNDGALNAIRAVRIYLAGAVIECGKLGVAG
jgi:hypothetical protein